MVRTKWFRPDSILTWVTILGGIVALIVAWPTLPTLADAVGAYPKEQVYSKSDIDGFRKERDGSIAELSKSIQQLSGLINQLTSKVDRLCSSLNANQIDTLSARLSGMRRDALALEKNSDAISIAIHSDLVIEIDVNGKKLDRLRAKMEAAGQECAA